MWFAYEGENWILKDVSLEALGLDTNEKKLAFAIQNYQHYNSQSRVKSLVHLSQSWKKEGKYRNPFVQEEAVDYLQWIHQRCIKMVHDECMKHIKDIFVSDDIDVRVDVFVNADSMVTAAGAVLGTNIHPDLSKFIDELAPTLESISYFRPTGEPDALYESYREHV